MSDTSPKKKEKTSGIISRPTAALTIHPALSEMPGWADDDPQFEALTLDISKRGFDYPLLITPNDEIVDGRHRWRSAKKLKVEEVPAKIADEKEVIRLITSTILQRRHYTKGALAYMTAPFFKGSPNSQEVNAQQAGISLALFKQAVAVRDYFAQDADFKAFMEPKILEGEVGLGAVIAGWAGREATKGKTKVTRGEVALWDRAITGLQKRLAHWEKFGAGEKAEVFQQFHTLVEKMPTELIHKLVKSIGEVNKQRKADK